MAAWQTIKTSFENEQGAAASAAAVGEEAVDVDQVDDIALDLTPQEKGFTPDQRDKFSRCKNLLVTLGAYMALFAPQTKPDQSKGAKEKTKSPKQLAQDALDNIKELKASPPERLVNLLRSAAGLRVPVPVS